MTEIEFKAWEARSMVGYAEDKMKANNLTREEAEKVARDDFHRYLPEGLNTKDNFLYSAFDENETRLGFIWFGVRGQTNKYAFILDVIIENEFRGKGYGRKIMTLIEDEVRELGLNRIGLHVFGSNKVAIGLYESLGYEPTDLVMEKSLS